ncbi:MULTISPECIES: DUF952 domain-containing protein [unclassified Streptomyces]|uniref:DUF952 domain-containing protein n=1 Tax=unclassified Streptomyces TaxID=2593676 RepID=UPI0006F84FB6|nr:MULTISPECIES: DUF952 domain-containing protein [unclassified Streptomyces]KQX54954.1 hypothetical protein ASD33_31940 [Streptomyces sp. Root1304]KRA94472.1 hypothetical protein ASE09_31725 [Streptomyces sp. Root66D1]
MLLHVVPLADWSASPAAPDAPYAPASLTAEGFVHCSSDESAALAVADAHYRDVPGPLLVLVIDEARLSGEVRYEGSGDVLFPHVYGPVERDAVTSVLEVRRDADGRARGLDPRA